MHVLILAALIVIAILLARQERRLKALEQRVQRTPINEEVQDITPRDAAERALDRHVSEFHIKR